MFLIRSDRTLQHQPAIPFPITPRQRIATIPHLLLNYLPRHLSREAKSAPLQLEQYRRLARARPAADHHQIRSRQP
jgi:hypothetical protein